MSNVLSAGARKEVWRYHRGRFIFVGSLVLLSGALLALLSLLPSVLTIRAQQAALSEATDITLPVDPENEKDRGDILRAQALVAQFSPMSSSTAPALEAILAALRARPAGASVDDIRYTTEDGSSIVINGAANRASISAYREALSADPHFENVSVPAGAFAGTEGGRFSITLTGAF